MLWIRVVPEVASAISCLRVSMLYGKLGKLWN